MIDDDGERLDAFLAGRPAAEEWMRARCDPIGRKVAVSVYSRLALRKRTGVVDADELYCSAVAFVLEKRQQIFKSYDRTRPLDPFLYTVMRNRAWDVATAELRHGDRSAGPLELIPGEERTLSALSWSPPVDVDQTLDVETVRARTRAQLTGVGLRVFELMFDQHQDDRVIAAACEMKASNVQLWRWRLLRLVTEVSTSLGLREPAAPRSRRRPSSGGDVPAL